MPTDRIGPPPGASPPMRMTASWSGSNDLTAYRSHAVGRQNSGKSTSPTTEPRERPMHHPTTLPVSEQTCSREDCATLFVSLELSRSTWVATSLALGSRKMSKHTLVGGDARKLLDLLGRLKSRAEQRIAAPVKIVAIQEAGLDGFWIHRLLEANGVESHVVDPASIAVPRRHRRAKTDAIDGETLLRTLMAWQRGEPRVCAMTVPPTPSEEDCRRVSRERATLLRERIRHTNRIRGLLFGQGIANYNPLNKNRRERLKELRTETDARCQLTSRRRFFARSTGLSWFYARSARSKLNAMKCCGRRKRALRLHYLCGSRALARSSLPCSTLRVCSATSRTDGSWRPMQAWLPAHGRVAASTTNRASRKQEIHGCARQ